MTDPGTAVVRGKGIVALIEHAAPRLTPLLPEDVTLEKLQQIVYFEAKKTPALLDCTPDSIVSAVARVLRSGLELGETCYLVPFGRTCTFVADYKGLAQLMVAGRAVRAVEMEAVRDGDFFEYELGLEARLKHLPGGKGGARPITHAYVILRLPGGMSSFKVMTAEDIDAIRLKHSKSWKTGPLPAWYACKTVLRQIAKTMPKDKRLAQFYTALQADEAEEFGERPAHIDADGVDRSDEVTPGAVPVTDAEVLSEAEDDMTDAEIAAQDAGLALDDRRPVRSRDAVRGGR